MLAAVTGRRLLATIASAAIVLGSCAPEPLAGTDLGTQPAPDFTLTDGATGSSLALSSLRPNVVAMAFLYTQCPDVCPLTAEHFRAAQERLGSDSSRVRFLAVSVDPERDTPAAVQAFSAAHRLSRDWHYLIGPRAALSSVWSAYGIYAAPEGGGPTVAHNDAIYLIDAKGNARVLLHTEDGVDTLVKDLKILLQE